MASVRFNPRALLATALFVAAVAALVEAPAIVDRLRERSGSAAERVHRATPATIAAGSIDAARTSLAATRAWELDDGSIRAFGFADGDAWDVAFYRRVGERYERIAQQLISGFDAPRVEGSPPRLVAQSSSLGARFVFRVTNRDVVFEPDDPRVHLVDTPSAAGGATR